MKVRELLEPFDNFRSKDEIQCQIRDYYNMEIIKFCIHGYRELKDRLLNSEVCEAFVATNPETMLVIGCDIADGGDFNEK